MPRTLEEVLADWSEQANVLRKRSHVTEADAIDALLGEVRDAAEDYITWLAEHAAHLRSGWSIRRLRTAFPEWEAQGNAMKKHGERYYRAVVLPQRTHPSVAREQGRAAARKAS